MNLRSRRGRMELARAAKGIREVYERIPKGNRFGVPTLRQVTAINRRFDKSKQKKRVKA